MNDKIEIPAIHDKEFIVLLEKLELMSEINENIAVCFNCHESLNLNNIAGIKIMGNKPKLICNNPECISNE